MKKHGIGSRLLALLLVLAMVLPVLPLNAFAANYDEISIGDIASEYIDSSGNVYDHTGKTGLEGNIDTQDTISWPIRIYDFLNDGMLFEYANAGDDLGDISDSEGGAYGGGTPAPHYSGAQSVIGNDYTVAGTYNENAYNSSSNNSFYKSCYWYTGSKIEAKNFVDPMHLRMAQASGYTYGAVCLSNFYVDNKTYYDKDVLRYVVIAYRTKGISDGKLQIQMTTNGSASYAGSEQAFKASSDWTYVVYDLKTGTANSKWSSIGSNNIDEVWFKFPEMTAYGSISAAKQYIDVSHIAYFSTEFEAIEFGKDAVAFDSNPGEFLDAHTEYIDPTEVPVSRPTTGDYNGMDFSVSDKTTGGYEIDTYDTWTATPQYYQYLGSTVGGVGVTEVSNGERSYVSISNSKNTSDRSIFLWEYSGGGTFYYVTLVYKTTGFTSDQKIGLYVRDSGGGGSNMATSLSGASESATLPRSENEWTYITYAVSDFNDGDYNAYTAYTQYGMYLPSCLTGSTNAGKSLDIAMTWLSKDYDDAVAYGKQAADYMNGETEIISGSYTTSQKKWNTGNSTSFTMLYANQGGGWYWDDTDGDGYDDSNIAGGENNQPNGYYSYQIGKTAGNTDFTNTINKIRTVAKETYGYPVSDTIYLVNESTVGENYNVKDLDLGYTLFNTLNSGLATFGLLEHSLTTVTLVNSEGEEVEYRVPDYKEDTVEYIALLLKNTLSIGRTDASGNYNYNYVQGTANGEQYGYDDGKAMDLASALRKQLNIELPAAGGNDTTSDRAAMGDYATMTDEHKAELIGAFKDCVGNINTFVDAAYYLLMNLYVDDSYNQAQDEYHYLVMSKATLGTNGKQAYVFDGGFTTGVASETDNSAEYRASSESAIQYDKAAATISMTSATSKDQVYFMGTLRTSRFPFQPVTDSTGVYAGETKSPYFLDEERGVMGVTEEGGTFVNRNFNYTIASNGEFVYHEEDGLFFDFEGDDDVYLFINGELVVDVGAAHSVTTVTMNVDDYVQWAKGVLSGLSGYTAGMSDKRFAECLANNNITSEEDIVYYTRAHRLNLVDGSSYTFDFYYMERHGWGANCRIATNIVVTDPSQKTDKQAYQGYDENGNIIEIPFGGLVDDTQPLMYKFSLTNEGNTKLYKMSFKDADIGMDLTWDKGVTTYGTPSIGKFTVDEATELRITGLNGAVNVDGKAYFISDTGTFTWTEERVDEYDETYTVTLTQDYLPLAAGSQVLTIYQVNSETLFTDARARIKIGNVADETYNETTPEASEDGTFPLVPGKINKLTIDGIRVANKEGKPLQASDLIITINGFSSEENYKAYQSTGDSQYKMDEFVVHVENDAQLKAFLTLLTDPAGQTEQDGADVGDAATEKAGVFAGSGLWRHATVTITGFWYTMSAQEQANNVFNNTVYTTAYGTLDSTDPKKGQDQHRVYAPGAPAYYQWAEHNLLITKTKLFDDAEEASQITGNQLSEFSTFYENVGTKTVNYMFCDKRGNEAEYPHVTLNSAKTGYLVNYPEAGTYTFYVLMYVGSNPATRVDGEYAIVPVTVFVTDVEDSVYVLDYGLKTEDLNTNGQLFKDDRLHGDSGADIAKLLGVTTTQPSYLDPVSNSTDYNRISFANPADLSRGGVVTVYGGDGVMDGYFGMDLAIPASGKAISYNAYSRYYSLSDPGTVKIHATVPVTDEWENAYLYFWYDNGSDNSWPGTKMVRDSYGAYSLDIPGDVSHVIINNAQGVQTVDLSLNPGIESWITLGDKQTMGDGSSKYLATVSTAVESVTIHVKAPSGWTTANLHYWGNSKPTDWPGVEMISVGDGWYKLDVSGEVNCVVVNDGTGNQTYDLPLIPGKEAWIVVDENYSTTNDSNSTFYYGAVATYSQDTFTVNTKVPAGWGSPSLYYWYSNSTPTGVAWPGKTMTGPDAEGWYSIEIPVGVTNVIITDGKDGGKQTVNVDIEEGSAGSDAWVTVTSTVDLKGHYLASVAESSIYFQPQDFMDTYYNIWMAVGVHEVGLKESEITPAGGNLSINSEVHMFKKVTVLPASVVYYEDDFPAIKYIDLNTQQKTVTVTVPDSWTNPHLYYWYDGGDNSWPGTAMEKAANGWKLEIPSNIETLLICNTDDQGNSIAQTKDLKISGTEDVVINVKSDKDVTVSDGQFVRLGEGSSDKTQSIDQNENYGHDATYANDSNTEMSGGSLTTIRINSHTSAARFTFKGTGFELISRTNAYDSGTMEIYVFSGNPAAITYDAATMSYLADGKEALRLIPLVTEYDNNAGEDGNTNEEIYQVPVIRLDDLEYGEYTVVIAGVPGYEYTDNGKLRADSCLYVDGLRIFRPMGSTDPVEYNDKEENATFVELRDMIVEGSAVVATVTDNGDGKQVTVNTGTTTWTENRNSMLYNGAEWTGTTVSSVSDYLMLGPNNEVYMDGSYSNPSAIVFYVKENSASAGTRNLQIAIRAQDQGKYMGLEKGTGMAAIVQYGVLDSGEMKWTSVHSETTISSATEQYYTIDYTRCPQVDGYYQVMLRVVDYNYDASGTQIYSDINDLLDETEGYDTGKTPAMVSYSSVKFNGLEIRNLNGAPANYRYGKFGLEIQETEEQYNEETGAWEQVSVWYGVPSTEWGTGYTVRYNPNLEENTSETVENGNTKTVTETTVNYWQRLDSEGQWVLYKKSVATLVTTTTGGKTETAQTEQWYEYVLNTETGAYEEKAIEKYVGATENYVPFSTLGEQLTSTKIIGKYDTEYDSSIPSEPDEGGSETTPGTLTMTGATLSLEDEIHYNMFFETTIESYEEIGLLAWSKEPAEVTFENREKVYAAEWDEAKQLFTARTGGVAAKNMGDAIYFAAYAKVKNPDFDKTDANETDPEFLYIYSDLISYSAKQYAMNRLEKSDSDATKKLCVALLNYGAAAQEYFNYKPNDLMNQDLTAEQKAIVSGYSSAMVTAVPAVDASKSGSFAEKAPSAFTVKKGATMTLGGALALNFFFTLPEDATSVTMYYWTADAYAKASSLSTSNATGSIEMTATDTANQFRATVNDLVAKSYDDPVYVAAVYEVNGTSYCTGVLNYSMSKYCANRIEKTDLEEMRTLAKALVVYGYYAKAYFTA